jgi:hypothetical protein
MPRVGFELTIPVFDRAKTIHALDCAATVIGTWKLHTVNCVCVNGLEITNCIMRCSVIITFTVYYGDEMKEGEMGGTRSAHEK